MITFGSLFTGVGGFDLGFERAGMQCLWQCEIDKHATAVLEKHWPNTTRYTDVREIGKHNLEPVDLICGGFPCQDLSVAGHRKGLAGERSGLWFEFHRILEEVRPSWVVIENVPGLLSSNKGRDFAVLLSGLVELGYSVTWRVLDSQYFGVAQRRRRVFIVGSLGNGRSAEVLLESEGLPGNTTQGREAGKETTRTVVGSLTRASNAGGTMTHQDVISGHVIPTILGFDLAQITSKANYSNPKAGDPQPPLNTLGQGMVVDALQATDYKVIRNQNTNNIVMAYDMRHHTETGDKIKTLESTQNKMYQSPIVLAHGQANAEITEDITPTLQLLHEQPIVWQMNHASEAYRESGEIVPTLQERMGTVGNNVPLVGLRRLTPTECERLQGFPDGWTADQSDTQRYKQMGNAVTVNVIEWIGRRIVEA